MPRLVQSINLAPWALTCIIGALRRDASTARRKQEETKDEQGRATLSQLASDSEHLASLFSCLSSNRLLSLSVIVVEDEPRAKDAEEG